MKKSLVKLLAIYATQEELRKFELIKAFHGRNSNSDMLRVLINNEAKRILEKNNASAINQPQ